MWLIYSLFSAILTGCVPILGAKTSHAVGAEKSAVIRAGFVLIGSGILALRSGVALPIDDPIVWLIFLAAGLLDAAAWLYFYRAIAGGSTESAVVREKFCVPISILLSCVISLQFPTFAELAAILLFVSGILYATRDSHNVFPILSAICTALQMQLSKFGIDRIGSQENALFLRSVFSVVFLIILTSKAAIHSDDSNSQAISTAKIPLLLALSGVCAFFAWSFCFSALAQAPAAKVQAVTKLNFWIAGLTYSFSNRGIERRYWFGYAAMTIGALVLIA